MKSCCTPGLSLARWLPLLGAAFSLSMPWQGWTQEAETGFEATLRLEKPRYLLGEQVRFWVGMRSTNRTPIPLDKPCTLSVTNPDGSNETQSVGPPPDHILGATFYEGGMGLGDKIQPGRYVLVWACSGQKTKPVELMVERNQIWDQLKAEFQFEHSGNVRMGTSVPVVLSVQNNSPYTIRFPQRGIVGAEISVGAIHDNPPFSYATFYPAEKLSHSTLSPSTYTWDIAPQIPSVVLQPGSHYEQKFLFEDAYPLDQPGNYKV